MILVGVGAVIALFVAVVATRPSAYHVERKVEIAAPAETVFGILNDLRQFAGVLVLLLALQIITAILPPWDRMITLLSLAAFIAIAVIYCKLLPTSKVSDVLTIVTLTDLVTVLSLPIIWVVKPSEWPKEMKLIACGLVVSLVLQTGCTAAAAWLKTLVGTVTIGVPLSSLIGMGFFFTALRQTEIQEASSMKRIPETHSLREDSIPLSPSS